MAKLTLKILDQKIEDMKLMVIAQGIDLLKASLKQDNIIRRHKRNIKYKKVKNG